MTHGTHGHTHKTQHSTHADTSEPKAASSLFDAAEALLHLPSVFLLRVPKWGGGNRAGHVIHGSAFTVEDPGRTGFAAAALESLN